MCLMNSSTPVFRLLSLFMPRSICGNGQIPYSLSKVPFKNLEIALKDKSQNVDFHQKRGFSRFRIFQNLKFGCFVKLGYSCRRLQTAKLCWAVGVYFEYSFISQGLFCHFILPTYYFKQALGTTQSETENWVKTVARKRLVIARPRSDKYEVYFIL